MNWFDQRRRAMTNPPHDCKEYFTFEALESGKFTLTIPSNVNSTHITSVSYSTNNGSTWTTTTIDSTVQTITTPTITAGGKVLWKGIANCYASGASSNASQFSSTSRFIVTGNIMSLLYGDNFLNNTTMHDYSFRRLFRGCSKLQNAENLILPSLTATSCCYHEMFQNCSSLITPPVLPATTLAYQCYCGMFDACTSLTSCPELPAMTMATNCYRIMFRKCTSLTTGPTLPALTLSPGSYCYQSMFEAASKLRYIKAMFTTTPGSNYTAYWLDSVASTGTFVKNSAATWNVSGGSGIPYRWTVKTASS